MAGKLTSLVSRCEWGLVLVLWEVFCGVNSGQSKWLKDVLSKSDVDRFLRSSFQTICFPLARICTFSSPKEYPLSLRCKWTAESWPGELALLLLLLQALVQWLFTPPDASPRKVLGSCPTGSRPRERPRTHWSDYIARLAWERFRIPSRRTGGSVWGDWSLGVPALTLTPATRPWISRPWWMDGWILFIWLYKCPRSRFQLLKGWWPLLYAKGNIRWRSLLGSQMSLFLMLLVSLKPSFFF